MNEAEGVYLPPHNKYPGTQHFSHAEELAYAMISEMLGIFYLVSYEFCPHEPFPLWTLLCIISLELNLSPEYNYMLSLVCPPTKSGDGIASTNKFFSVLPG